MKIGYITSSPAEDIKIWSGTTKFIYDNLKARYSVDNIVIRNNRFEKILLALAWHFNFKYLKLNRYFLNKAVKRQRKNIETYDILFLAAQSEMIGCKSFDFKNKKIIYLSDATYHLLKKYYKLSDPQDVERINESNEIKAITKASNIIYASDWAKSDAITYYKTNPKKISVIPFGANLPDKYKIKENKNTKNVKLLLVGVDWERKGINTAIETVKILNQINTQIHYTLTIVGVNSNKHFKYVDIVGRLDKSNTHDLKKLISIYQDSDIFILPTRAECAGIVFCEASMYGLPSITYNTGGVSTYVKNNRNGFLLNPKATAEDFARNINMIVSTNKLQQLKITSRQEYEKRLNWDTWIEKVDKIL